METGQSFSVCGSDGTVEPQSGVPTRTTTQPSPGEGSAVNNDISRPVFGTSNIIHL